MLRLPTFKTSLLLHCWELMANQSTWSGQPSIIGFGKLDADESSAIEDNLTQICNVVLKYYKKDYSQQLDNGLNFLNLAIENAITSKKGGTHSFEESLVMYVYESINTNVLKAIKPSNMHVYTDLIIAKIESEAAKKKFGKIINEFVVINKITSDADSELLAVNSAMIV